MGAWAGARVRVLLKSAKSHSGTIQDPSESRTKNVSKRDAWKSRSRLRVPGSKLVRTLTSRRHLHRNRALSVRDGFLRSTGAAAQRSFESLIIELIGSRILDLSVRLVYFLHQDHALKKGSMDRRYQYVTDNFYRNPEEVRRKALDMTYTAPTDPELWGCVLAHFAHREQKRESKEVPKTFVFTSTSRWVGWRCWSTWLRKLRLRPASFVRWTQVEPIDSSREWHFDAYPRHSPEPW